MSGHPWIRFGEQGLGQVVSGVFVVTQGKLAQAQLGGRPRVLGNFVGGLELFQSEVVTTLPTKFDPCRTIISAGSAARAPRDNTAKNNPANTQRRAIDQALAVCTTFAWTQPSGLRQRPLHGGDRKVAGCLGVSRLAGLGSRGLFDQLADHHDGPLGPTDEGLGHGPKGGFRRICFL